MTRSARRWSPPDLIPGDDAMAEPDEAITLRIIPTAQTVDTINAFIFDFESDFFG